MIAVGQVWELPDVDLATNEDVTRLLLIVGPASPLAGKTTMLALDLMTGLTRDYWTESLTTWARRGRRVA